MRRLLSLLLFWRRAAPAPYIANPRLLALHMAEARSKGALS